MVTDLQVTKANYRCKHTWTRVELESIKSRYLAKEPMPNIGASMKISAVSIARVLRILGVTSRARGKIPMFSADQKVQILILLQNHTQSEVAEQFGVSRWTIQKIHAAHKEACNGNNN